MSSPSPAVDYFSRRKSSGIMKSIADTSRTNSRMLLGSAVVLIGVSSYMMYVYKKEYSDVEMSSFVTFVKGNWGKTTTYTLFVFGVILASMGVYGSYKKGKL